MSKGLSFGLLINLKNATFSDLLEIKLSLKLLQRSSEFALLFMVLIYSGATPFLAQNISIKYFRHRVSGVNKVLEAQDTLPQLENLQEGLKMLGVCKINHLRTVPRQSSPNSFLVSIPV